MAVAKSGGKAVAWIVCGGDIGEGGAGIFGFIRFHWFRDDFGFKLRIICVHW